MKIVARNKKAWHLYAILDKYEAGVALKGTEVKSLRAGKVNFSDSFARLQDDELWLDNLDISPYAQGNINNHEPRRQRKLLLHRREIRKIRTLMSEKGLTLMPLAIYFNERGKVKIELGVCRGKKLYDKREDIAGKEAGRLIKRIMKS
ncbi:MAG: SsrA-binding protein SmpB [Fibrobacterota bacterium]